MGAGGFVAVGLGAAFGAWLRWGLGLLLNPLLPALPLGTLAANLVGGYLMGIVLGMLSHYASLPVEIRLFVVTGFLGGLTTFSTFSAEAVTLLSRQQYAWMAAHVTAHLLGAESELVTAGLLGFNPVLTAIALGAVFYRPGARVVIYALLAAVLSVIVQGAMMAVLAPFGIPTLTAAFILVTWLFLLPGLKLD